MRDVIQRVIAAEAEAKRIVEAAKKEAERIGSEAQTNGRQLVSRARQEVRAEAERMVASAIQEAERKKKERLDCLAAEIKTQVCLEENIRQSAVAGAIRCVCGPGQPAG